MSCLTIDEDKRGINRCLFEFENEIDKYIPTKNKENVK